MGTEKVSIGCKLPHGLVIDHEGVSVRLNGAYSQNITNQNGRLLQHTHGLTHGVDKEFYDAWRARITKGPNGEERTDGLAGLLARGIIFDATNPTTATTAAKTGEKRAVKTGFESLDPERPAPGIEPTDEQRTALKEDPDTNEDDGRPPRMR